MGFFSNLVSRFAGSSTKQGDEPLDSGESAQLSRALSYFEKRLRESDVIRPEGVQVLLDAIGAHAKPGVHFNIERALPNQELLSLEEKKSLGLNSRKKYSRQLVRLVMCEHLHGRCPKELISDYYLSSWHQAARDALLQKMRSAGVVDVRILSCSDERDCPHVLRMKRRFKIDDVPALPLQGCDAAYCRCTYVPEL